MSNDKKKHIYEAALSLIYENNDMMSIKVSDIAKKADIGKGTIYEYFSSKEQLIAEAVIHLFQEGLTHVKQIVAQKQSAKEMYVEVLQRTAQMMNKNKELLQYVTTSESCFTIFNSIHGEQGSKFVTNIKKEYATIYKSIVEQCVKEGILSKMPSAPDLHIAIANSVVCMHIQKQGFEEFEDFTEERMIEKAFELFIKLLRE